MRKYNLFIGGGMSVVDFAQIEKVYPGQTENISGSGSSLPVGPTISHPERPTLLDPLWGYVQKFGQVFGLQYDDAKTYGSVAVFTLQGEFTRDCVAGGTGNGASLSDTTAFNSLVAMYNALDLVFHNAAESAAPANFTTWGTSSDSRCIPLPKPFVDVNGNPVYALPVSLVIQPGLWSNGISYEATMVEAKFPQQKLVVNGIMLDSGVINIKLPGPILIRRRLAGCVGEAIQVENYTCMECSITGKIPRDQASGDNLAENTRALTDSLSEGGAVVQLYDRTSGLETLYGDLDPDAGGAITAVVEDLVDSVSLNLKAQQ